VQGLEPNGLHGEEITGNEPAWDPRRLYTLEARMEPWTGNRRHRRGTRLS
jgi:hypothetical protein